MNILINCNLLNDADIAELEEHDPAVCWTYIKLMLWLKDQRVDNFPSQSVSYAARVLNMSHRTLSAHLAKLEKFPRKLYKGTDNNYYLPESIRELNTLKGRVEGGLKGGLKGDVKAPLNNDLSPQGKDKDLRGGAGETFKEPSELTSKPEGMKAYPRLAIKEAGQKTLVEKWGAEVVAFYIPFINGWAEESGRDIKKPTEFVNRWIERDKNEGSNYFHKNNTQAGDAYLEKLFSELGS